MNGTAGAYGLIERVIRDLDERYTEQPSLDELAAGAGLSGSHLQRLFRRWAGISPKRFLQYATAAHVRQRLKHGGSLLDVAYDAGLSGPGRLHDLVTGIHAVTPAELRSGGAGVEIAWGFHDTRFGRCLLAQTDRGICRLVFLDAEDGRSGAPEQAALAALHAAWPGATLREDPSATGVTVRRAFGAGDGPPPALLLSGTNFQLSVWDALLRIPSGAVVAYEDVAAAIGRPAAVRAVGAAIGSNTIAWLIPCHRVIRKTGAYGGYRWGVPRKRLMLAWEAARSELDGTGEGPARFTMTPGHP
jgi:AraC family transcriptional regulator, regulatory protein of adaptative response / methylated-DNA-[protein]-cysteine methyltransferase